MPPSELASALVRLYEATAGEAWQDRTNWLQGEPCVDRWHGISCCPETHPVLTAWPEAQCAAEGDDGGGGAADVWEGAFPASGETCASGRATGNASLDSATCVVVAVELSASGLQGELNDMLDGLPRLQVLHLNDNELGGSLPRPPRGAEQMLSVQLELNRFDYVDGASYASLCSERCTGLPPTSCAAFGARHELMLDDPTRCVECWPLWKTGALFGSLLGLFFVGVVCYIYLMLHQPDMVELGVNTAAIVFGHTQTLSLIGLLRLGWPKSAEVVTDTAGLDVVSLGGSKPECFFTAMDDESKKVLEEHGGTALVITVARMALVALCLLGTTLAQLLVKRCAARAWCGTGRGVEAINDTIEFVETAVFSLQITITIRASVQLLVARDDADDAWVGQMGSGAAVLACLLQAVIVAKYVLAVRTLEQKRRNDGEVRGGLFTAPSFLLRSRRTTLHAHAHAQAYAPRALRAATVATRSHVEMLRNSRPQAAEGRETHNERATAAETTSATDDFVDDERTTRGSAAAGGDGGDASPLSRASPTSPAKRSGGGPTGRGGHGEGADGGGAEGEGEGGGGGGGGGACSRLGERWDRLADEMQARFGWAPGGRTLPRARLEARLAFLTERFRAEAPYWQFVLWVRQIGLALAVSIPEMLGGDVSDGTLCAVGVLAIAVLGVFTLLQLRAKPYPYAFQNTLEVVLLCSAMVALVLGLAYAFVTKQSDVVEALLLVVLLGSIGGGAAIIVAKHCHWCRGRPAQRPKRPAPKTARRLGSAVRSKGARDNPPHQMAPRTMSIGEPFSKASKRSHGSLSSLESTTSLVSENI